MTVTDLSEKILFAYHHGLFPMADDARDTDFYWVDPPMRGQLSIPHLHIPTRLKRTLLNNPYTITINTAFADVIDSCAASTKGREKTWINGPIRNAFIHLHAQGHAHSVEVWRIPSPLVGEGGEHREPGEGVLTTTPPHPSQAVSSLGPFPLPQGERELVGGIYGLSLGQIFCGESMFSRATDTSKIALVHLVARLHATGFKILDTQFTNDHLKQFGVYDIPRADYHDLLRTHADIPADFTAPQDAHDLLRRYLGFNRG